VFLVSGIVVWYRCRGVTEEMLAAKFGAILPHLDERERRLV
jgi:hypothetical protein